MGAVEGVGFRMTLLCVWWPKDFSAPCNFDLLEIACGARPGCFRESLRQKHAAPAYTR